MTPRSGPGRSTWPSTAVSLCEAKTTTLSGVISGAGNVTFTSENASNNGEFILSGTMANSYSGTTYVYIDLVQLNKSAGTDAIPGDIEIGGWPAGTDIVRLLNQDQIADSSAVILVGSRLLISAESRDELGRTSWDLTLLDASPPTERTTRGGSTWRSRRLDHHRDPRS